MHTINVYKINFKLEFKLNLSSTKPIKKKNCRESEKNNKFEIIKIRNFCT